jgi:hypothetical protein
MRRVAFTVFLLVVAAGGGWLMGQQQPAQPYIPGPEGLLTGPDLGFRMEGTHQGKVVGTLMVRMKTGEWVPASLTRPGVVPLESR